jgi:thioredoxin-dependent peroxiredoxin
MLAIGEIAPDFAYSQTTLYQTLEKVPAVVYFYPADFTPVCTKEACMFRDAHVSLAAAGNGLAVIGISPQNDESHRKFKERYNLPFSLVADGSLAIAKAYKSTGMFGLPIPFGVRRVTYLVGKDRTIVDRATGELSLADHERLLSRAGSI